MNPAILLLTATTFLPPAAPAATPGFGVGSHATFVKTDVAAEFVAAAPRAKSDSMIHGVILGGIIFNSASHAVTGGGGVVFQPMKDNEKISVQADVLLFKAASQSIDDFEVTNGNGGASLGFLISVNALYDVMKSASGWAFNVGGGIGFFHAGGTTTVGEITVQALKERSNGGNWGAEFRIMFHGGTQYAALFHFGL